MLGFLALIELSTLSRSGFLGIAVGLCVLAVPYRRLLLTPRVLVPLGAVAAVVAYVVMRRSGFFETVFESRTQLGGSSVQAHFAFYSLIRPALEQHLFFGLGLNTFSSYYEFLTGKTNFGPHSFYVALLTEAGLVGAALYAAWLVFLFSCLGTLRRVGRQMARAGDRAAARVRPLGVGPHRGARRDARRERLLPDDADVLLHGLRARSSLRRRWSSSRAAPAE